MEGVVVPLVGRETELAALAKALGSESRPRDVVIRGEAGIGKTSLWRDALRAADARGVDLVREVAVPPELEELLRSRIVPLSERTRWLLVLAATAAVPDLDALAAAMPTCRLDPLLHEAERARVLDLASDPPRFVHPLLVAVILAAATPNERRGAHAALARVIGDDVGRARHVAASVCGYDESAAMTVEHGARRAARRAAPATAAPLFERASGLTPPELGASLGRRTVQAVDAWAAAGHPRRAVEVGRRSLGLLPSSPARARVLAALAGVVALVENEHDAVTVLQEAAVEATGDDAATALVLRRLGWSLAVAGDPRAGLRAVEEGLAAAERCDDPVELTASLAAAAMLRFLTGTAAAGSTMERAVAVLPPGCPVGDRRDLERDRTIMAAWADDADAAALIATQRAEATDRGDAETAHFWRWYALLVRLRTGPWTALVEQLTSLESERYRLGIAGQACSGLWLVALTEAHLGRVDDARRHAEAGIRAARDEHMVVFELWCEGVLGFVEASTGEHERAARRLWDLHRRCEAAGIREPGHLRHLADAVEALIAADRLVQADELAGHLQELGLVTGHPWAQAAGLRCRGLVREAEGQRDAALIDLQRAVELHEQLGQPFELGRTLLAHGAALRRARQKAAARRTLDRAMAIFEELPAPLWRDRVTGESTRVGGPARSGPALSATEHRIAELVARGRSNREVAAELFLSRKTVEWNLSKVYRKVGVRSRSELASTWVPEPLVASGGIPGSSGNGRP